MKIQMTTLLAMAIAAAIPFAGSAANKPALGVRDMAVAPAQSQSDRVQRIIVNYREGSLARRNAKAATAVINQTLSRTGLSAQALGGGGVRHMRKLATGHDLVKLPVAVDRVTANALIQQIAANRDVLSVEVDEIKRVVASPVKPAAAANDTYYTGYQWHFQKPDGNTDGFATAPNRGGANVADAWDLSTGVGITVAVLDTGITAHPDLDTSLADAGYDFITDGWVSGRGSDGRASGGWDLGDWTWQYPDPPSWCPFERQFNDSSWHGTHVAATVGAELTNNAAGMAGIAYGAKVLPVRVLGHCGGFTSDIVDGLVWASGGAVPGVPDNQNPAQVINLSLGSGGACSSAEATAVADALARGVVVVAAAGNSNQDAANHAPSNCPGVISVAASGITSARAAYSNYGPSVHIAAPGGGGGVDGNPGGYIWQAWNSGLTTPTPLEELNINADYIGMTGTSMASPHVAGIVALMQSARLNAGQELLHADSILTYLLETVTPFAVTPSVGQPIGPGIVNAAAAVVRATCEGDDCTPPPPPPTPIFNRTPIKGLSGGSATWVLTVPAGAKGPLSIMTSGGKGDLTLLVHQGEAPDNNADWALRSARRGNSETVRINNLQPGEYYIRLIDAPKAYSGVTLRAIHK